MNPRKLCALPFLLSACLCLHAQTTAEPTTRPASLTEREVSFKTVDGLTLPGTLTLPATPKGAPKPSVAVLEQGSGVHDRNATVGQNKFFQQLAYGLAARGVASLRYDRRAKVDLKSFKTHADLDHEVVLDAVSALAFVQTLPDIDAGAIFYAGHSLGAELGPDVVAMRLAQKPASVRGMLLLSGIARPPDVVINEQIQVLGAAQGGTPEQIAAIQEQWTNVWNAARNPATPADTPLGVGAQLPATYWRDWLRRDPVATMRKLPVPTLLTRGNDDVNAPHADFVLLKAAASTSGSDAREFAGLNHIYMPAGSGMAMMAAGTVSPEFLDYIAKWITHIAAR